MSDLPPPPKPTVEAIVENTEGRNGEHYSGAHQPRPVPGIQNPSPETENGNGKAHEHNSAIPGTIPEVVLKHVLPHYRRDDIQHLLAETTLMGMVEAYRRDVARTEHAFGAMYKERESTYWRDVEERESVAKGMHRERFQARAFLRDVKEGMKAYKVLTPEQEQAFEDAMVPPKQRNGASPPARG